MADTRKLFSLQEQNIIYMTINGKRLRYIKHMSTNKLIPFTDEPLPTGISAPQMTCLDFYKEHYNLTDQEMRTLRYHFEPSISAYLDICRREIGLLSIREEKSSLIQACVVAIYEILKGNKTYVYDMSDERWLARTILKGSGSTSSTCMTFNHRPGYEDLDIALAIKRAPDVFDKIIGDTRNKKITFVCHNCRRKQHFLNLPGNLSQKLILFEERWCGFC